MPSTTHTVPLALSLLSAGEAFEVADDVEPIDLNTLVTGNREGFLACVIDGVSMVPHIQHGDIAFVDTWASPKNGDTVVCSVNGAINVKKFTHGNGVLRLVPANGAFAEREITPSDNFHVIGVVRSHLAFE